MRAFAALAARITDITLKRVACVLVVLALVLADAGSPMNIAETAPLSPAAVTPTSLKITVTKVELESSIDGDYSSTLLNTPSTLDVIANTGLPSASFGSGTANEQTWNGMRVTLANTGTYSGVDPCTGATVTDAAITLPNSTDQGVILQYQVPHQVKGVPPGALAAQSYTVSSTPLKVRVVFPVTNSVACASDSPPVGTIAGSSTQLNAPFFLYVYNDATNNVHEIGAANGSGNRITVYEQTDSGDVSPVRAIHGTTTGLNGPIGVAVDDSDPTNPQLVVSNTGNNSITAYPIAADGDAAPSYTIKGSNTQLNGPGGLYVDAASSPTMIGVVNGASNSISVYSHDAVVNSTDGNVAPAFTISGPNTELSTPCGVYHYQDSTANELYVTNSNTDSITVYDLSAITTGNNDVKPIRTIQGSQTGQGDHTGLGTPCGVYVDAANQEIAVANNSANSITFYNRLDSGNVYPSRTISGTATGLNGPIGLALLGNGLDEIVVANDKNNALTIHKRNDATPFLAKAPILMNSGWEQTLYPSYSFTGTVDRTLGQALALPGFDGYRFVWKITSDKLRQPADATDGILIPPVDETFTMANGHTASTLPLACNSFTPFTILQLFTNCHTDFPLITSPFPPEGGTYRVAATLFGKVQDAQLTLNVAGLSLSEVAKLVPTITLGTNSSILGVQWDFENLDSNGNVQKVPAPLPLLMSQQMQITLTQSYQSTSSCYTQVAGNNPTLVYQSPGLGPDVRSLSNIKNNNCDIFLNDVDAMTFTLSNAYGAQYIFNWKPG